MKRQSRRSKALVIAGALLRLAKELLASRRSKVVIVVDENRFGIIPGLRALGYNNIKTFPAGTPDQVIHDALNKMRGRTRNKAILLVTENAWDFTQARRGTEPNYTVVCVPAGMLTSDVPAKLDALIKRDREGLKGNRPVPL